jgi:hypothetical protein
LAAFSFGLVVGKASPLVGHLLEHRPFDLVINGVGKLNTQFGA